MSIILIDSFRRITFVRPPHHLSRHVVRAIVTRTIHCLGAWPTRAWQDPRGARRPLRRARLHLPYDNKRAKLINDSAAYDRRSTDRKSANTGKSSTKDRTGRATNKERGCASARLMCDRVTYVTCDIGDA